MGRMEKFLLRGYSLIATLLICLLGYQNLQLKDIEINDLSKSWKADSAVTNALFWDSLSIGSNNAPIEVVLFLEPECPTCLAQFQFCIALEKFNPGLVQILPFFVVSGEDRLLKAAACYIAGQKSGLESYLQMIQESKPANTKEELSLLAQQIGFNSSEFLAELEAGTAQKRVSLQRDYALNHGVRVLPSLMVNGELLSGIPTIELNTYFQKLGLRPVIHE